MIISTRHIKDVVVFDIEGEMRLPLKPTETLHQLVKTQLDQGARKILFNFHDIKYIDSYGVGELVASYISIHDLGGKLKLTGVAGRLELLLKTTDIYKLFDPQPSEKAALKILADR